MEAIAAENLFGNDFKQAAVDPGIEYPCYKSFDEFIHTSHLRSLDSYITEKTGNHIKRRHEDYFVNLYRLSAEVLSFSISVDGIFTDEFRARIPRPEIDPASTPVLWASRSTNRR